MTVFERCWQAAMATPVYDGEGRQMCLDVQDASQITTAVLTALAEHTGSPRTVDEVMRVLGEVG